MSEIKRTSTTGWVCLSCTFINILAISNCSMCSTPRPYSWKCAKKECGYFNKHKLPNCENCGVINADVKTDMEYEKVKVMRNTF